MVLFEVATSLASLLPPAMKEQFLRPSLAKMLLFSDKELLEVMATMINLGVIRQNLAIILLPWTFWGLEFGIGKFCRLEREEIKVSMV